MAGANSFGRTLKNGLLILVLAGLLVALLYGVHRWTERYDHRLQEMSSRIGQQADTIAMLETSLSQQSALMQKRLSQQQSALDEHQMALVRLGRIGSDEWQLREAHALSRMAQQRLQLMGDYDGAVRLLEAASSVLLQVKLPKDSEVRSLLQQDIELVGHWYQSARQNLRAAAEAIRTRHPAVFRSAQELSLQQSAADEQDNWHDWFERLPLRFTPRQQTDLNSLSVEQARQQLSLFRFLFAQAEIAGLMQKHADQSRVFEEMSRLVQSLPLADRENLVLLQQAIEDARQQSASLDRQLELKSPSALAALVQGG